MRTKRLLTSTKTTSPTHKSSIPTIIKKQKEKNGKIKEARVDDENDEEGDEDMVEETTNKISRAELKELIYRLKDRCEEGEHQIKKLKVELDLMKSKGRKTKQKIRSDFCWDGEEANLADKISNWVKTFLFP
jgi:hypothetical protein